MSLEQLGVAASLLVSLLSVAYSAGVLAARVEAVRQSQQVLSDQIAELRGLLFQALSGKGR